MRLRLLGTPHPMADFALAAITFALGIAAVALSGAAVAGWVALAVLALFAAYFVAIGVWSGRHRDDVTRYWRARRTLARASMRRHPLRWLIGLPIVAGVDAALRWNRHGHHSTTSTVIAAAIGAAIGVVVVGIALRRAGGARRA